ncbi:MAG: hypothetical protein CME06_12400 [Gemmatimonadetes bacterium]|nr:hypothetical protein [Gemmatimonadota bacterium]
MSRMRCNAVRPLIAETVDADADERVVRLVELHAEECVKCRSELDRMRAAIGLLESLEPVEAPADFEARVMARVRTDNLGGWTWREVSDRVAEALALRPLRTAALVATCAVLGVALLRPVETSPFTGAASRIAQRDEPIPVLPSEVIASIAGPVEVGDLAAVPEDSALTAEDGHLESAFGELEARLAAETVSLPLVPEPLGGAAPPAARIVPAALDARDRAAILETGRSRRSF